MFGCVQCSEIFTLEDVKKGLYFPSTGMCLSDYIKLATNKLSCFGKEEKYNPKTLACGTECPDSKMCKAFIKYKKEFISIQEESNVR